MRVAFYKGRKRLFNRLVSWWTLGPYSHVELVFENGESVSSSFMDGGVRYKRIQFNSANWDFINIEGKFDEREIRLRVDDFLDTKYDWLGLIGFVVRRVQQDRKKMFCSEFVLTLLNYNDPWRFEPNTAYCAMASKK